MPQKLTKNTFNAGMNLDADITMQPKGTYREANNVRVTVNEDSTMGTIENVKGNLILIYNQFEESGEKIVGTVSLDSDLIVFTVDAAGVYSRIYRFVFDGELIDSYSLLWEDSEYGSSEDRLNLSTDYPIKAVSRKETSNIEKIYWIDDNNYLRYANIAVPLTTDGEVKSASNDYVSAKTFNTVSNVTFVTPEFEKIGSGGLNVGAVQYSYQLYNKNGSESSFSPTTGLYHLTSSSDSAADSGSSPDRPRPG